MCIRTFSRLKYRRSIFHIKVIFGNNYSNFANFCITIGPFDTATLHLSGKNLNSFSSKIALRHFYKSGDDMTRTFPEDFLPGFNLNFQCSGLHPDSHWLRQLAHGLCHDRLRLVFRLKYNITFYCKCSHCYLSQGTTLPSVSQHHTLHSNPSIPHFTPLQSQHPTLHSTPIPASHISLHSIV